MRIKFFFLVGSPVPRKFQRRSFVLVVKKVLQGPYFIKRNNLYGFTVLFWMFLIGAPFNWSLATSKLPEQSLTSLTNLADSHSDQAVILQKSISGESLPANGNESDKREFIEREKPSLSINSSNSQPPPSSHLTVPDSLHQPQRWRNRSQIRSEFTKYNSPLPDGKLNQSLSLNAEVKFQYHKDEWDGALDFMAEHYAAWNQSQFALKELYASRSLYNPLTFQTGTLSVGRKICNWSMADSEWALGLWQPLQVYDGLRPEQQGLAGVFWSEKKGSLEATAYTSPIFIPTMSPEVKSENGILTSNTRWFRSPSQTFRLNNQQRQIIYSIDNPDIGSLIAKPGGGARLLYDKGVGLWASGGFAYKPMNKLLLKYKKQLVTDGVSEDKGEAVVYPVVGYHNLVSFDLGYKFKSIEFVFSFLQDNPKQVKQDSDDIYIMQRASPSRVYSGLVKGSFSVFPQLKWKASFLRVEGGELADYDAQGANQGAIFSSRYQYKEALSLGGEIETYLLNHRFIPKTYFLREFDQQAILWKTQFDFYALNDLYLTLGFDILGGDQADSNPNQQGFLNEFRANDRGYAGVSYVF